MENKAAFNCFWTSVMDLAALSIFRLAARELSVTRTAQQLGRVPSNVTTRIQQLEEELGVALFQRDRKRLALTPQGKLFLDDADRILGLSDEARQVLNPGAPSGVLRIGSMECTVASRLPQPLASFHRQWPDVRLEVSTAPSGRLIDAVLGHRLDCALLALPPGGESADESLDALPLFREELVLLAPPGHGRIDGPADVVPRTLAAFGPGCTYRAVAQDWLAGGERASEFRTQDIHSYHAMLACVAAGSCVSVMPRTVLDLMRETVPVVATPLLSIDTVLIRRSGVETPAFAAWREVLAGYANVTGSAA
jgi:DNA-binding transcriptional LysR family regulator